MSTPSLLAVRFRESRVEGRCEMCRDWWPLDEEFWQPRNGLRRCKACWREYHRLSEAERRQVDAIRLAHLARGRASYQANKAERRARQNAWKKANPEKVAEYQRRYREKHREKQAAASRAYYAECRDAILLKKRAKYREQAA